VGGAQAIPTFFIGDMKVWCHKVKDQRVCTLGQDCVFRTILISGLLITAAIISWILIVDWDDLTFICDSYTCMASMMDVLKLPIAILTAAFAVAGFYAVVFRSQQTAIQIQETLNQNIFKNYLDHKKQFMDMLKGFEEQHLAKFFNKDELYVKFFPKNSPRHVDFHAVITGGDKSELEYLILEYNKSVANFNKIVRDCLARSVDEKRLVRWLADFLVVLLRFNIVFYGDKNTVRSISSRWQGFVLWDKKYINYPKDFEVAFYQLEDILNGLAIYCLPDVQSKFELQRAVSFGSSIKKAFDDISLEN
jgi:hypothetical protein